MWSYITEQYDYYIISQADPRITDYPLMDSPKITIILCLSYLIFVKIVGPAIMKNRKPLEINKIVIVYNALQTIYSFTMVIQGLYYGLQVLNFFGCNPHVFRTDPLGLKLVQLSWLVFMSRFFEFFDTIFFILRKKDNQVTILHVFHHFIVPLCFWVGLKVVPGSQYTIGGLINVFVHTIMYFYYMVAAMGPEYKKYIWWKRYMTVLQLVQCIIIIIHAVLTLASGCEIPQLPGYLSLFQAVAVFILFLNFYRKTFTSKKEKFEPLFDMNKFHQKYKALMEMCIPNQHVLYEDEPNTQEDQRSTHDLNTAQEQMNKTHLE